MCKTIHSTLAAKHAGVQDIALDSVRRCPAMEPSLDNLSTIMDAKIQQNSKAQR